MKLPRNLDDLVESGRHNIEGLVDGGRKGAQRLYDDGRHWIGDRLPDARPAARDVGRSAERARDQASATARRSADQATSTVRRAVDDERLRAPVRWLEARLPEPRRSSSVLLPSVLAAAGAGVAFWWWTSWSRGRAEAAERAALDAAGGAEGKAHPEAVMAHAPEPAGAPVHASDRSAAKLSEPAEDVMAHTPPPAEVDPAASGSSGGGKGPSTKATADEARLLGSTAPAGLAGGVQEVAPAKTVTSLDESLAVQGSSAPKTNGQGKPSGATA